MLGIKNLISQIPFVLQAMTKLKLAYRYLNQKRALTQLLKKISSIEFDGKNRTFMIMNNEWSPVERVDCKNKLMKPLSNLYPSTSIPLDSINAGYLDRCLEHYIYQRIDMGIPNQDTCLLNNVYNNGCMGWIDPDIGFALEEKKRFLNQLSKHKAKFKNENYYLERMVRRSDGFVFERSDRVFTEDDAVLKICRNIREYGFNPGLFISTSVVIGYSTTTRYHNMIAGRHRIAALKYLVKQGELDGEMKIKCHLIKYPYESLTYIRPYNHVCQNCEQAGITVL